MIAAYTVNGKFVVEHNIFDAAIKVLDEHQPGWESEYVHVIGIARSNIGNEYKFTCTRVGDEVEFVLGDKS